MEIRSAAKLRAKRRRLLQLELDTPLASLNLPQSSPPPPNPPCSRYVDDASTEPGCEEETVDSRESVRAPVPFVSARKEALHGYQMGLSTNLSTPSKLTLAIAMYERLIARDWSGSAAIIPLLSKRFRRVNDYKWYFARELLVAGSEVIRRCEDEKDGNPDAGSLLRRFLETIMRSDGVGLVSAPGYGLLVRETALLELIMELIAADHIVEALEITREEIKREPFVSSTLIQGCLGILNLLYYEQCGNQDLLKEAAHALQIAAGKDPDSFCFTYYAAACDHVGGHTDQAIEKLKAAVARSPADPYATEALMRALLETDELRRNKKVQKQRIDLARRLAKIDPMAEVVLDAFHDSKTMHVGSPEVTNLEIARVYAGRIETASHTCSNTWKGLADALDDTELESLHHFWKEDGRCKWWPKSLLRPSRASGDYKIAPELAMQKRRVALLVGDASYLDAVNSVLEAR